MLVRRLSALALTAALAAVGPVVPAQADEATDAPVTRPDSVTLRGGSFRLADVLRNDRDPNGDDLEICRVDVPDGVPINDVEGVLAFSFDEPTEVEREKLLVLSSAYGPGTYELTYYACDRDYLTPGTLTVTVTRTKPVRARKVARGVVRFVNPDDRAVRVSFSGPWVDSGDDTTDFVLRPGQARRFRVDVKAISWSAHSVRGFGTAGDGVVRRLDRA